MKIFMNYYEFSQMQLDARVVIEDGL